MMMIRKNKITIISMIILSLLSLTMSAMIEKKITKKVKVQTFRGNATAGNATAVGTDVFAGKNNASNAVGVVGTSVYTIAAAPYVVQTCDQVLQIPGTTLDLNNYSVKARKPAFMTLSIYFANFFPTKNSSQLIQSMETQMLTNELTPIAGAPGCTVFKSQSKQYSFCFESDEIRQQIQVAAQKFLNCKPNPKNELALEFALKGCDLSKVDLTKNGPFGTAGPKIQTVLAKMKNKKPKKDNYKGVNPYYISKGIPGDNPPVAKKVLTK
jgi:hypothetical protein